MPRYFDVHAHVQFASYKEDADDVIERAAAQGIYMVAPSSQSTTSERAVEYSERYDGRIWAAVGLHPLHLKHVFADPSEGEGPAFETESEQFDYDFYRNLAAHEKTVAVGECGLDYHPRLKLTSSERDYQEDIFRQQLELALDVGKPVIVHLRSGKVAGKKASANSDALRIIGEYVPRGLRGLIHCYSGNEEQGREYMDMGFFLSFTGLITYNTQWDALLANMPLEFITTETDAPYLTPEPERSTGEKTPEGFVRNEPTGVLRVVEHIAKLRNVPPETVAEQTFANARQLFGMHIPG
jgi:TatD DNase family protein